MRKALVFGVSLVMMLGSCVTAKKYRALQSLNKETQELLDTATLKLNTCLATRKEASTHVVTLKENYKDQIKDLKGQLIHLKNSNQALLNNVGNLATLSTKEAQNLERSLESIKEKDLQIRTMNEAINKRDSITLALVTSLKGALGSLNDRDIEVNVEKGVVYVSISDKLLFKSGKYDVSPRAKKVLGKVATVVNDKPEIEFLVEGHTDNRSILANNVILDNWDLSVKRATSVVRILQNEFGVDPKRMTAAGRSFYAPVFGNDSSEGRAANRRTRIVVLPKLDQFYDLIKQGQETINNASTTTTNTTTYYN